MNFQNALAGLSVNDIQAAIVWYQALIGRPPDIRPMPHVAGWQFPGGGWVEIFEDPARAGNCTVIFAIVSLERQLEELEAMGITVINMTPSEFVGEVAIIYDPDGNQIVFADPRTGVMDD